MNSMTVPGEFGVSPKGGGGSVGNLVEGQREGLWKQGHGSPKRSGPASIHAADIEGLKARWRLCRRGCCRRPAAPWIGAPLAARILTRTRASGTLLFAPKPIFGVPSRSGRSRPDRLGTPDIGFATKAVPEARVLVKLRAKSAPLRDPNSERPSLRTLGRRCPRRPTPQAHPSLRCGRLTPGPSGSPSAPLEGTPNSPRTCSA